MKDEKEYLRRHWILWNWLAEHSGCDLKRSAFEDLGWDSSSKIDNPKSHCYLCELFLKVKHDCPECPLQKASGRCCNHLWSDKLNYYDHWHYAQTNEIRRMYALLIRDVVPKPEDV
jgi:hypothetical protein